MKVPRAGSYIPRIISLCVIIRVAIEDKVLCRVIIEKSGFASHWRVCPRTRNEGSVNVPQPALKQGTTDVTKKKITCK